ncbi:unnamed protein product [Soboliphyme baturini]|uniref:PPM-type phosphatase domain-containing protein n=1 Tax=Soboliphyme baturini TaxID=241478 RepID=A0A183IN08_9BILA|nr:unnamed protein product [Soboliphyme baturini]
MITLEEFGVTWLHNEGQDELRVSRDQKARPVIVPKDPAKMPMFAGYAETVNAGKTSLNEDQAVAKFLTFMKNTENASAHGKNETNLTTRFSTKQSFMADEQLLSEPRNSSVMKDDNQIEDEKALLPIAGGCTAVVALFLAGKLYVATAGDCRALLCSEKCTRQLSTVFTPLYERKRLQSIAYRHPNLLRKQFSRLIYSRTLTDADLNSKVFYQDWYMDGWAVKTVQPTDLLPSMIGFYNQKCRLFNTIAVTRGFGDHHLVTAKNGIQIKNFLSALPEVNVVDFSELNCLSHRDVLVLASDGLWNVLSTENVVQIITAGVNAHDENDVTTYTLIAEELVAAARGQSVDGITWLLDESKPASDDDISVFVIPLKFAFVPNSEDDVELLT